MEAIDTKMRSPKAEGDAIEQPAQAYPARHPPRWAGRTRERKRIHVLLDGGGGCARRAG